MIGAAAFTVLALAVAAMQEPAPAPAETAAARHLIFLAEQRPIFVRLRVTLLGRPFEASWIDSIRVLHASLDRNGDGTLTVKEADPKFVSSIVRLASAAGVAPNLAELDVNPKDGKVSVDELAEALRATLGPFQLQVGRQAVGRTDALFDQLDRDKDGALRSSELAAIAGSLRPLDLDDNEMISADELEPYNSVAFVALMEETSDRRARLTALPPVVELLPGESSLRPVRLLLKKYDKGRDDVPGRPDNKLSPSEFAIDPDVFAAVDKNKDDALDTDELRRFLAKVPTDLTLEVSLSPAASGAVPAKVETGTALPKGAKVRRLADGDVEFAIGYVRLDIHIDDGADRAKDVRRVLGQRFKAADANKDGYLEGKEWAALGAPQSPLAILLELIDRDADGKIYLKELLDFADRQQEAARSRLVVTAADQGRAIFGILDLDRDRRLSAREVMRTVDRAMSWDSDSDGRVSADEIPHHFQVAVARGGLPGLFGQAVAAPVGVAVSAGRSMAAPGISGQPAGPEWFDKMDSNHDGDISRREFVGPRDLFDRLDRDKDGLIDRDEAGAAVAAKPTNDAAP
jgi:Ca2+-binding EF-hand superfamily protein